MCANFDKGLAVLMVSQPFFSSLLFKVKHTEDPSVPTLCVSTTELRYSPEFIAKLDLDQTVFVLAHEVMHLAYMHLPRIKAYFTSGVGPDGKPFNPLLFNVAADFPINAMLDDEGVGKAPTHLGICLDKKRFPATMSPEEIYIELNKDEDSQSKAAGMSSLDEHDAMAGPAEGAPTQGITDADVQQAINIHKATVGKLPGGLERLLDGLRKPAVSPWKRLRKLVNSALGGRDTSTWKRLNRRYLARGIGAPGKATHRSGRIGVVIDTSGSICDEVLQLFGGHLAAIVDDALPDELRLYWVDHRVQRVDSVVTGSQLRNLLATAKVPGGGGTDMPEGVEAAVADKCDTVVVLTDGYTPFCAAPKPVIWAITTANITSPHGETVHITG